MSAQVTCDLRVVFRHYGVSYRTEGTCCHPRLKSKCDNATLSACKHKTRLVYPRPIERGALIRLNPFEV